MEKVDEYINSLFEDLIECYPLVKGKFKKSSTYYKKGLTVHFEYYPKENTFFYSTQIAKTFINHYDLPPSEIKKLLRPFANRLTGRKNLDIRDEPHWKKEKIQERVKELVTYQPKKKIERTI